MNDKEALAAYLNGKEIQYREKGSTEWLDKATFNVWDFINFEYQAKPQRCFLYAFLADGAQFPSPFTSISAKSIMQYYAAESGKIIKLEEVCT